MSDQITVRELIARLQQVVDQDKPVVIWNNEYSITDPLQDWDETDDEFVIY